MVHLLTDRPWRETLLAPVIAAGYSTDFEKDLRRCVHAAEGHRRGKLFLLVHYYTPYTFCGLTEDAP